jgi:hypothetical protein
MQERGGYSPQDGEENKKTQWSRKLLPETVVIAIDERDRDDSPDYAVDQDPRAEALLQDPQYVRSARLAREFEYIVMSWHYEMVTRQEGNPDALPPFPDTLNEEIALYEEWVAQWRDSKGIVPVALDFKLKQRRAIRDDYQQNPDVALHHLS